MEDQVDVLMATYKTEIKYLKKQIDSILKQTHKNIKLLISDDNSESKELENVLKEYEKNDKRVKIYFQKQNLGYIKNFEFLLSKSNANYIMFSDHDDVWYNKKIEKSLKTLKEKNVDLVYCNAKQINEEGKVLHESYFKYKNMPLIHKKGKLAMSRCAGLACSQIFTKSVKEKMLPYKKEVIAQDWLASFVASENKGIEYIEEPLYAYRLHQTNIFGGRNLNQNLTEWKKENGKTYEAYLKYRNQKVIDTAYLNGIIMCEKYSTNKENKEFMKKAVNYYKNLKKSKYINLHLIKYFEILSGKNLLKKSIKEIMIFHFPIIGYIYFLK